MEHMGIVGFYEIYDCNSTVFLADIGIYNKKGDAEQHEAERIAKLMSPTATAHFDRCGEVYA